MLNSEQLDRIQVVLVSPRNPLNIGAAARAMANFSFSRLTVVAPYAPHWREAQSAIGAEELLSGARVCATLKEALAPSTLVLGTATLAHRTAEQPVVLLPEVAALVRADFDRRNAGRVALVFGAEKHGLSRDDLALCHRLLLIPTAPRQPSMNLGQAVALCLYELATRLAQPVPDTGGLDLETREAPAGGELPATAAHLDRLAAVIAETMQAAHYSPARMEAANRHDLDLLLRRLSLTASDVTRILGLFRRILWRLRGRAPGH